MDGILDCDTRYPLLLVHGIGFHDHWNRVLPIYWGRIPAALEKRGARIFYGHQDSWATIEHNADIVKESLLKALAESNSEKVNIIAHSKGGLDTRYMISTLGMADKVASLTTLGSPHHGSKTIDLLCGLPRWMFRFCAFFVDLGSRILGDSKPDFYRASRRFSTRSMEAFNGQNPDAPSVYYQSYAASMKSPLTDLFLMIPYLFVKRADGESDGLVTLESAAWADFKGTLGRTVRRGVSHTDLVDIRRRNHQVTLAAKGCETVTYKDIGEFFEALVSDLKRRGF